MLFDHLNKFSKRTALISENLEKLSYSELISRADKIGGQVTKKIACSKQITQKKLPAAGKILKRFRLRRAKYSKDFACGGQN